MKRISILLALCGLLLAAGCSDSDESGESGTDLLVGKWELTKYCYGESGVVENAGAGTDHIEYITFHSDGTYYGEVRWNDSGIWREEESSGIYTVSDGKIFVIAGGQRTDWKIERLTRSELIVSDTYGTGEQTFTDWGYYKRVS